jgi:hypothetical protein
MLDRTNMTFLSEKFLAMYAYILMVQMTTIVIVVAAAVMAILVVSIVAVSTTFAVTDNNNTDAGAEAVEKDSGNVVAADGSSDHNESAKSGINTTVCGPDAAHACQTSAGQ